MIELRKAEDIYQTQGEIENGTFQGRWHFSFGEYYDHHNMHWGTLRVFNDDTLSPGAVWPLHPHRDIEVVTYCAAGEFRHADERGQGGVLRKGWVQHTTFGRGMFHSEINNLPDQPMRVIQMWFTPLRHGLSPSVQQKQVRREERTNRLLPLVSNDDPGSLPIASDAKVHSCFLSRTKTVTYSLKECYGAYLYLLEGGGITVNDEALRPLDAAAISEETNLLMKADADAELLFVVVPVT